MAVVHGRGSCLTNHGMKKPLRQFGEASIVFTGQLFMQLYCSDISCFSSL